MQCFKNKFVIIQKFESASKVLHMNLFPEITLFLDQTEIIYDFSLHLKINLFL